MKNEYDNKMLSYDVQEIPIDLLEDNPYEKRNKYGDIEGLAVSIKERGLQNPISVIKSDNRFIIVYGHRRAHAFRYLKEKTIPAIIRKESSPQELMIDLAIENMQRKDLLPVEKGATLEQLFYEIPSVKNINDVISLMNQVKIKYEMKKRSEKTKGNFDDEDIIRANNILNSHSMSTSKAIMHIKLLLLPNDIQGKIVSADNATIPEGMIGFKSGYELTRVTDPKIQKELSEKIIKEKMTHAKIKMVVNKIIEENVDTNKIEDPDSKAEPSSNKTENNNIYKDDIEISKLTEDLFYISSKIESFRSKFPIITERLKKTELDASLDKMKAACLDMIINIDNIVNEDSKNEELLQYIKDTNLEVEISGDYRWRLPSKIIDILGIEKGDVLILKIDAIKKISDKLV